MQIITYLSQITGKSAAVLLGLSGSPGGAPPAPLVGWRLVGARVDETGAVTAPGAYEITLWDASLTDAGISVPTADALATALAAPEPGPTQAQLAEALVAAASAVAGSVTSQVAPDQTHLAAYVNAALIVGPSATVPSGGLVGNAFTALATANGFGSDLQAFATLVVNVAAASLTLTAAYSTLVGAVQSAKTASDLAAVLSAFEDAVGAVVSGLNAAGLPITISAPAPISIRGINA